MFKQIVHPISAVVSSEIKLPSENEMQDVIRKWLTSLVIDSLSYITNENIIYDTKTISNMFTFSVRPRYYRSGIKEILPTDKAFSIESSYVFSNVSYINQIAVVDMVYSNNDKERMIEVDGSSLLAMCSAVLFNQYCVIFKYSTTANYERFKYTIGDQFYHFILVTGFCETQTLEVKKLKMTLDKSEADTIDLKILEIFSSSITQYHNNKSITVELKLSFDRPVLKVRYKDRLILTVDSKRSHIPGHSESSNNRLRSPSANTYTMTVFRCEWSRLSCRMNSTDPMVYRDFDMSTCGQVITFIAATHEKYPVYSEGRHYSEAEIKIDIVFNMPVMFQIVHLIYEAMKLEDIHDMAEIAGIAHE